MILLCSLLLAFGNLGDTPSDEIRRVLDVQAEAWNRGDIAGYMEGYWKSDSLVFTSGGTVNKGWQATFEKYSAKYHTKERMGTLVYSDIEVVLMSEEVAWVLGKWKLVRKSDQPEGVFTLIVRRFPEGWRIVHDHTSVMHNK